MTFKLVNTAPHDVEEAVEKEGYASFNGFPHLCVDVPDGGFTISAKTSEGKRVTFSFLPYKTGGPAQCVDIVYHDSGNTVLNGPTTLPVFDCLAFTKGKTILDTRNKESEPAGILCVLMSNKKV